MSRKTLKSMFICMYVRMNVGCLTKIRLKMDVTGKRDKEHIVPNLYKVKKMIEKGKCYIEI